MGRNLSYSVRPIPLSRGSKSADYKDKERGCCLHLSNQSMCLSLRCSLITRPSSFCFFFFSHQSDHSPIVSPISLALSSVSFFTPPPVQLYSYGLPGHVNLLASHSATMERSAKMAKTHRQRGPDGEAACPQLHSAWIRLISNIVSPLVQGDSTYKSAKCFLGVSKRDRQTETLHLWEEEWMRNILPPVSQWQCVPDVFVHVFSKEREPCFVTDLAVNVDRLEGGGTQRAFLKIKLGIKCLPTPNCVKRLCFLIW